MSTQPISTNPRVFALAMLNGSMDDADIIPFLDGLKESGYEGICLHPRDGLRVPYHSRKFWERYDRILELSKERGFAIWFYDEFPFPSGMAGGIIPADDPSTILQSLRFDELSLTPNFDGLIDIGPEPLLALLRYSVDEAGNKQGVQDVTEDTGAYLNSWVWGEWHNRYYTGTLHIHEELHERAIAGAYQRTYLPETPLGEHERLLAIKIVPAAGRAGLPGRVDVTRPEVTDRFLEMIYGKYAELANKHGLKDVPMFQDEVTFGATWPWNVEVERRLRAVWGEELTTKLAALHAPDCDGWENTRLQYRTACHDAFEQNFFVRVKDYCHANNLLMTGHLAGEETIYANMQLLGDVFKNLRHFDIPGFDIISSTIPNDINRSSQLGIKVVQSAAWQEGRKPTMVEVFGAHGFHQDVQRHRNVVAWLILHDLVQIFDHSTYLSSRSIRKYDAPPVNNSYNPLDAGRADLWQWHNWFADLMKEYAFNPKTLVFYPVESFARYNTGEVEHWRPQIELIETWYHTVFSASLDAVLIPGHRLAEVQADGDGFEFDGQRFKNFIIPPVASFHEDSWKRLRELSQNPHFAWCATGKDVTVFGDGGSHSEILGGERVYACDEETLLQRKASFFDEILDSPLSRIQSKTTLLKTQRTNRAGKTLTILLNTQDEPIEVQLNGEWGARLAQPPLFVAEPLATPTLRLMPREVVILEEGVAQPGLPTVFDELLPVQSHVQINAPNHLSLTSGRIGLEGQHERDFEPAPVSSLWPIEGVEIFESDAVFAPPFSRDPLPKTLEFQASFEIVCEDQLTDLQVLLDEESGPDALTVLWDGVALEKKSVEVYDRDNTAYVVPAELLTPGSHELLFQATVHHGLEGVRERPILHGNFLAMVNENDVPILQAAPMQTAPWRGETWPVLGIPEGYGPVDYEFVYELNEAQAAHNWQLQLPPTIGVAEITVNDELLGRSSWEPRVAGLGRLKQGENRIGIRVHGSWNNVFSRLNRLENGLTAVPVLRSV